VKITELALQKEIERLGSSVKQVADLFVVQTRVLVTAIALLR